MGDDAARNCIQFQLRHPVCFIESSLDEVEGAKTVLLSGRGVKHFSR